MEISHLIPSETEPQITVGTPGSVLTLCQRRKPQLNQNQLKGSVQTGTFVQNAQGHLGAVELLQKYVPCRMQAPWWMGQPAAFS